MLLQKLLSKYCPSVGVLQQGLAPASACIRSFMEVKHSTLGLNCTPGTYFRYATMEVPACRVYSQKIDLCLVRSLGSQVLLKIYISTVVS